jgi:Ca-activated chloride channel family protein
MRFLSPDHLWLLAAIPLVALAYILVQWRRRRFDIVYTNVAVAAVASPGWSWRRHLTAGIFLLMLAAAILASARPAHVARVARERAVTIVAIDASRSMLADDVGRSRLAVAKRQAAAFVRNLPHDQRVGIVVFTSAATLTMPPTAEHRNAFIAIDGITFGDGTAVGEAIFESVAAIHQVAERDRVTLGARLPNGDRRGLPPAGIVILSDGETTEGRTAEEGANAARADRIPVSTISIGTRSGAVEVDGQEFEVPVRRQELVDVAARTGGQHYSVTSEEELQIAYSELGSELAYRRSPQELTGWFIAAAFAAGLAAAAASFVWVVRLP